MKRIFCMVAILAVGGLLCPALQGAQQIFWPIDQWPPSSWTFTYTNEAVTAFSFPGSGTILLRHLVLTNLPAAIAPPPLGSNAVLTASSALLEDEISLNLGGTWSPTSGSGTVTFDLAHTNDSGASRLFGPELVQLDVAQPAPPSLLYRLRESPFLQSLGQVTMESTAGGFLISGFIQVSLEMSADFGATWQPANSSAYLELAGPAGIPAILSISAPAGGNIQLCWTTQTNAHYQLQVTDTVGANWTNSDVPVAGNGSNVCASVGFSGDTNAFYRVQVLP